MLLSNLLRRHKTPAPQFAPGLFLGLLVAFTILGQTSPIVGLTGIGTTLLVTGVLVTLNRQRIWDDYRKNYKKRRGPAAIWSKPNPIYYTINVLFLWPFIVFLGVVCLYAAYVLS
jgi:hypothetical protein